MALVDVIIPTCNRKTGLAVTLTGLFGQTYRDFGLLVSDQTETTPYLDDPEIATILRAFRLRGANVRTVRHLPRRGMAEHRHFMLSQATARYVLMLDDDVLLEPEALGRMVEVITQENCGFVGCVRVDLSHFADVRPAEHFIEIWDGPVQPEQFVWANIPWQRTAAQQKANMLHIEWKLAPNGATVRYKVPFIANRNVLYDREKLLAVGGFSWWPRLPAEHEGAEVPAQWLLMYKYGGCGILPGGTYQLELPTEVLNRRVSALQLYPELLEDLLQGRLGAPDQTPL